MKHARNWILVFLAFVLFAIAGCNTIKGVGRDIERGGEKIQDVAE